MNSSIISHSGTIDSISSNKVRVRILQSSACSGCKISAHCSSAESKEKIVDVAVDNPDMYAVGQEVNVIASASVGFKAVAYGFALPTLLLIISIVACLKFMALSEGISALIGLGTLIPYYAILYLLRDKIKKMVQFSISTTGN